MSQEATLAKSRVKESFLWLTAVKNNLKLISHEIKTSSKVHLCLCLLLTNNGEELVGAAVREEAAHGVPSWEGGQTLTTVLMGLEAEGRKTERMKVGGNEDFTCYSAGLCQRACEWQLEACSYLWQLLKDHQRTGWVDLRCVTKGTGCVSLTCGTSQREKTGIRRH